MKIKTLFSILLMLIFNACFSYAGQQSGLSFTSTFSGGLVPTGYGTNGQIIYSLHDKKPFLTEISNISETSVTSNPAYYYGLTKLPVGYNGFNLYAAQEAFGSSQALTIGTPQNIVFSNAYESNAFKAYEVAMTGIDVAQIHVASHYDDIAEAGSTAISLAISAPISIASALGFETSWIRHLDQGTSPFGGINLFMQGVMDFVGNAALQYNIDECRYQAAIKTTNFLSGPGDIRPIFVLSRSDVNAADYFYYLNDYRLKRVDIQILDVSGISNSY